MGACCSTPTNREINGYMASKEKVESKVAKLLLLGPGATGKSTLFRSLQMSHQNGTMRYETREGFASLMVINMLDDFVTLIAQCNRLYKKDNVRYKSCQLIASQEIEKNVDKIQDTFRFAAEQPDNIMSEEPLSGLAGAIKFVWDLDCIQATYKNRANNFAVSDNLLHFLENIDTIMKPDFVPDETDCLRTRSKTTGVAVYDYEATLAGRVQGSGRFQIIDVGGQRVERKKWINVFDNVDGIIFVGSLVDFDKVLYEDDSVNGMLECVNLFDTIVNKDIFASSVIILLLNKNDIFIQQLKKRDNGFFKCFSENGVWPNPNEYWDEEIDKRLLPLFGVDPDEDSMDISNLADAADFEQSEGAFLEYYNLAIEFIKKLFVNRTKKQFYVHITVATDPNIVVEVFNDIQMSVLNKNLESACMIAPMPDPAATSTNDTNDASDGALISKDDNKDENKVDHIENVTQKIENKPVVPEVAQASNKLQTEPESKDIVASATPSLETNEDHVPVEPSQGE